MLYIGVALGALLVAVWAASERGEVGQEPAPRADILPSPTLPKLIVPYSTGVLPALDAPASDLLDYVRGVAGTRFAGMWLDDEPPLGFRVAIVAPTRRDRVKVERALRLIGTVGRVVAAKYRENYLVQVNSWLGRRVALLNQKATVPVSAGERPDLNSIELIVPQNGVITRTQAQLERRAVEAFGSAVTVTTAAAGEPYPELAIRCAGVFCDPPLRSGIQTFTDAVGCTGGFVARSRTDGLPYQFTSGHCRVVPSQTWLTNFANLQAHAIGPAHRSRFDSAGDAAIVRISNPVGWQPRGWVAVRTGSGTTGDPTYPLFTSASPVVGVRVCVSGGASGAGSCGVVTAVGVTASFSFLGKLTTVKGLARANFCASSGDSGSPVFASHTAYGILSAGARSGINQCSSLFEPIRTAENLLNVNTVYETPPTPSAGR
jgi:hypothetical protein